ncbi:19807_t:CDS:1 [Entrophospora sp. SA101]|nr:14673_t:CDS:1 [Entrophospora sp. SA101]CAJ0747281.1 19807_t:CDS:1 [Entrophospora sp. SA101]CAJ0832375.1 10189_t:CDS:1 [Entrophospora sp. SA101]CAJ0890643.1 2743_t:CDS:1 [Entrophospora sp. SA101]
MEVDKLGYSYQDIVSSTNADFTAQKAYEELKKKILGSIDETLGLNKDTDSETISKWVNFKEYNTSEKIEALLKDLYEATPEPSKEGEQPAGKKIKAEFLTFIGKPTLQEFLKEKSPQEVVATIRRFELKDLTEEAIKAKEPKGTEKEFEANKEQIKAELETIQAKLEEIEKVGQTLTAEEGKIKTAVAAQLAHLATLKGEEAPKPNIDVGEKPKAEEKETTTKTQEPAKKFPQ